MDDYAERHLPYQMLKTDIDNLNAKLDAINAKVNMMLGGYVVLGFIIGALLTNNHWVL